MGEHDALGHAGRAGGVDDRRLVAQLDGVGALSDLLDAHALSGARQDALGTTVQGEDMAHTLGAHGFDQLGLLRGGRNNDTHVGVGQDVRDLRGRVRLVDGHGDGAAGQRGHVNECPLVGGGGQDRQMVAGLEPDADEATRDRVGFTQEGLHRDRTPRTDIGATLDCDLPGVRRHALVEHLWQVHVLGGFSRCDRLPRAVGEPAYRHCGPFVGWALCAVRGGISSSCRDRKARASSPVRRRRDRRTGRRSRGRSR